LPNTPSIESRLDELHVSLALHAPSQGYPRYPLWECRAIAGAGGQFSPNLQNCWSWSWSKNCLFVLWVYQIILL